LELLYEANVLAVVLTNIHTLEGIQTAYKQLFHLLVP
jgi:hypothetical protein